jgi:type II secretory pathway component PulC
LGGTDMKRSVPFSQIILVALAVVLVVVLYRTNMAGQPPLPVAKAQTIRESALPAAANYAPPPLSAFAEISTRPLFSPTRKPPPPKPVEAEKPPEETPPNLVLVGVVIAKDQRFAVVKAGDGTTRNLSADDSVDGWQVTEVESDHIALTIGDRTERYDLQTPAGSVAPR